MLALGSSCTGCGFKQSCLWRHCRPVPAAGRSVICRRPLIEKEKTLSHILLKCTVILQKFIFLLTGRVCGELPFRTSSPAHSAALASHKACVGNRLGEWRGSANDTPLWRPNSPPQRTHSFHHTPGVELFRQPLGNRWPGMWFTENVQIMNMPYGILFYYPLFLLYCCYWQAGTLAVWKVDARGRLQGNHLVKHEYNKPLTCCIFKPALPGE